MLPEKFFEVIKKNDLMTNVLMPFVKKNLIYKEKSGTVTRIKLRIFNRR